MASVHGTQSTGRAGLHEPLLQRSASTQALSRTDSQEEREEERALLLRRVQDPEWRLDRGAGYFAQERERNKRACLVQVGRHAGRSRVKVAGISPMRVLSHKIKRDFFNSAVNAPLHNILLALAFTYFGSIFIWGTAYYVLWSVDETCFTGIDGLVTSFLFAVETQQTIGYGVRAPGSCWVAFWLVSIHSLVTVVLDSLILGIAFARVSHPKNRGRTILISNCAVIARQDGELKFMFRVADIQPRPVTNAQIRALLYTWGPGGTGRITAEGDRIPVTMQELPLQGMDQSMLLPVIMEHIVDDRSPLAGQTPKSLEAVGAEIVVLFTAVTELGDTFSLRHSYLPSEIHWGHVFSNIIEPAQDGFTQHSVNIARFHDVEPQAGLDMIAPHRVANKVMTSGDRSALPAPIRGANTLVLSDHGVVGAREGKYMLMFRVGDVYPGSQVLDIHISAYLYRYQPSMTPEGEVIPFTVHKLRMDPSRPFLRYPCVVTHSLDSPDSPIHAWRSAAAKRQDSDAEILVVVEGVCAQSGQPRVRQRVYPVLAGIRWGAVFAPMLSVTGQGLTTRKGSSGVHWPNFHQTAPAHMEAPPAGRSGLQRVPSWATLGVSPTGGPGTAAGSGPGLPRPPTAPASSANTPTSTATHTGIGVNTATLGGGRLEHSSSTPSLAPSAQQQTAAARTSGASTGTAAQRGVPIPQGPGGETSASLHRTDSGNATGGGVGGGSGGGDRSYHKQPSGLTAGSLSAWNAVQTSFPAVGAAKRTSGGGTGGQGQAVIHSAPGSHYEPGTPQQQHTQQIGLYDTQLDLAQGTSSRGGSAVMSRQGSVPGPGQRGEGSGAGRGGGYATPAAPAAAAGPSGSALAAPKPAITYSNWAPTRSGENTVTQSYVGTSSHNTTRSNDATARGSVADWVHKRSLFAAIEEMVKLQAEEEAARLQAEQQNE